MSKYMSKEEIENLFGMDISEEEMEELEFMYEYDIQKVNYLVDYHDCTISDAIFSKKYEDVIFYEGANLDDVARDMVDDGVLFGEVPNEVKKYLDYDQIAHEMLYEYDELIDGVFHYV